MQVNATILEAQNREHIQNSKYFWTLLYKFMGSPNKSQGNKKVGDHLKKEKHNFFLKDYCFIHLGCSFGCSLCH